jgi:hypothetical protein
LSYFFKKYVSVFIWAIFYLWVLLLICLVDYFYCTKKSGRFLFLKFLGLQKMENSENQNMNLGVKKLGKNIKKNRLHKNNNFHKTIITNDKYPYLQSDIVHIVHKDDFKSFVQQMTETNIIQSQTSNENRRLQKNRPPPLVILRPQVQVHVPTSAPIAPSLAANNATCAHPLELYSRSAPVENTQNNIVESPISAFMRNFEDWIMDVGNSGGNQFHSFIYQTQLMNNVNFNRTLINFYILCFQVIHCL